MTKTRKSTPHSPQFRQAAIPTRGHANNANNFSYEKTPLRYNLRSHARRSCSQPVIPAPIRASKSPLCLTPRTTCPSHVTLWPYLAS